MKASQFSTDRFSFSNGILPKFNDVLRWKLVNCFLSERLNFVCNILLLKLLLHEKERLQFLWLFSPLVLPKFKHHWKNEDNIETKWYRLLVGFIWKYYSQKQSFYSRVSTVGIYWKQWSAWQTKNYQDLVKQVENLLSRQKSWRIQEVPDAGIDSKIPDTGLLNFCLASIGI